MSEALFRRRLEAQGFHGLDDDTLRELEPWFRLSPALCAIAMAIGVALGSPMLLWSLATLTFFAALLPYHPFDLLYNFGIRFLTGTRPLPRMSLQRRVVCALSGAWLLLTGWAFHYGATPLGLVLGVPLTAMSVLVSTTHICVPSLIFNWLFGIDVRRSAYYSR